jgi:flagellar motility protein MotE (MotC chaperone)
MKNAPRLLPLIAVAIGGVLAIKALSGVQALPALMAGPRAQAEEPAPARHRGKDKAAPAPVSVVPPVAPVSHPMAPVCAQSPIELAKAAGLSPGELQTLQNLGTRRGQLDDRERKLDTQMQLLAAAEGKVDAKLAAMNALKAQLQGLLGQVDKQQASETDRLTLVYQKMKPRDAAAIMATLDDQVRIPVAAKMKDAALAAILAQMPTVEAKKLTENLAHKFTAQSLSQAEEAPAAALLSGKTVAPAPDAAPGTVKVKPARKAKLTKTAKTTSKTTKTAPADAA